MTLSIKTFCLVVSPLVLSGILAGCAVSPSQVAAPAGVSDSATITSEARSVDAEYNVELPAVPLTPDTLYKLLVAETALQRGHYAVGFSQYFGLAKRTRDPRLAAKATRIAIFVRDHKSALQSAKLWVDIDPTNLAARQAISAAYIRSGNPDAALEHLEYILVKEDDGAGQGFMLVASLLSREQDLQAVLGVMERLVDIHQENYSAWQAYAHLALRAGAVEKADAGIKRSLHLEPDNVSAILLQARILRSNGDKVAVAEYLAQRVDAFPRKSVLRLTYARQLVDARDYDEAFKQYQIVMKQSPGDVDVLFALGLLALQLDRQDSAFDYLSQAKETGQRSDDAHFYLGQLEELRENETAALEYYSEVVGGSNLMEARVRQAMIEARQGNLETARNYLHSLHVKTAAERQRLFLIEGEILRNAERDQEALALFNYALNEIPADVQLLYARAMVAERLDQLDLAERDLKKIIELDENNADALNALGYTLADRTDRYQEAHGYVKRALALRPNDNAILDSMGWVLYRLGKYNEAIKMLRQSLKIRLDPEVAAHLGEVLWVSGEREDAREIWRQALEVTPGDKRLLNIMERFIK
ncbi:FIG140336: TPR domain protein [hydrothermal vent metagenome]|uniref:FIG140336: TPR domain protein n=1 Tax=hydrothermal vent metagenome TaxID=652676 RepID=A0A3B1A293_9ZZZZ